MDASEHAGGAGATFAEVAVICEELGRAAAVTGYLGGAVLAVGALVAGCGGEPAPQTPTEIHSLHASGCPRAVAIANAYRVKQTAR